jgi:hypothetical protein
MLYAMMEFTVSLLARRPATNRRPVPASELRQRLLALSELDQHYRLVEGQDCDLQPTWEVFDPAWSERFARVKLTTVYRAWILLDQSRHELRMHELLRSTSLFVGFDGWRPILQPYLFLTAGLTGSRAGRAYGILSGFPPQIGAVASFSVDTVGLREAIAQVTNRAGWTFRPTNLWFQATSRGFRGLAAITPAPIARLTARRFWGVAYPASYSLAIAYLVVVGGFWELHSLLLVAGISAAWFAVWGFLVWLLLGFPPFWRRQGQR